MKRRFIYNVETRERLSSCCTFFAGRYMEGVDKAASNAFVGLAAPGEAGSWQVESKVSFSNTSE